MRIRSVLLGIGAVSYLALSAWHVTAAQQSTCQDNCRGLHAGITAELTQGYSDPSVMVGFLLLNDSEKNRNTAPESWKIIIDGKESKDSGWIFGNGPAPTGGYGTLAAQEQLFISARHYKSLSTFLKRESTKSLGKARTFRVQQ